MDLVRVWSEKKRLSLLSKPRKWTDKEKALENSQEKGRLIATRAGEWS